MTTPRMPVLFAGHGNPMNAIADNRWSQAWRRLGESLPRPKAILCVSAHWYVPGTFLTGDDAPRTLHDFGGFPRELYDVQYPAPGQPALADRVARLLQPWHASSRMDWGLDHGTWSVLRHLWPKADLPTVQLSIDGRLTPDQHLAIGQALAPLRDEGVLVLGSGNLVHNLRHAFTAMRTGQTGLESWAEQFDDRVVKALDHRDGQALADACTDTLGHLAHPTPDHYLPVLYTTGAAGSDADVTFPVEGFDMGSISMRAVRYD
jgi:4,5-DOPA dioxygenase extradiol